MNHLSISLGLERLSNGDYEAIHEDCIAAIKMQISNAIPYFLLGVIAFDHGNHAKALELFSTAEKLDPVQPYYVCYLAMILSTLRTTDKALNAADRAAALKPKHSHLADMIGVVYSRCGRHETAIEHFKTAVARDISEPNYFFNLAASQEFLGLFEDAEMAFKKTLDLEPNHYRAWSSLISLKKQSLKDNHLAALTALFEEPEISPNAKLHLGHAIAKTFEDLGQYDESLEWLLRAKEAKRAELPFNREQSQSLFKAAARTISASKPAPTYDQSATPIFIVGLPRTGTTLIDRILSSHSQTTSLGEISVFAETIKSSTQTPSQYVLDEDTLNAATEIDLSLAGQLYLKAIKGLAEQSAIIIDKMPLNFFYAGLISKAFPNAKIIAVRREPTDSCLSNFRQIFSTQFSHYNYTFDLDDTAFFYRQFDTLMHHWRGHLCGDQFMEVFYEDVVNEQEHQTRRLLDFCELPWEDRCMLFHENPAAVSTASAVQVRRPLYSSSIGRWTRYTDKMERLRLALGDLVG